MLGSLQQRLSSSGRCSLKWLFALVLCVFSCGYVLLYLVLHQHLHRYVSPTPSLPDGEFVVDTSACGMLRYNVTDNFVENFVRRPESFKCPKALLRMFDSRLWVNMNASEIRKLYRVKLANLRCFYQQLWRESGTTAVYGPRVHFPISYGKAAQIAPDAEFIRVDCRRKQEAVSMYTNFHFIVQSKRPSIAMRRSPSAPMERVSVLVLALASMSHMNFLRQMPLTVAYIRRLSHVEFWGYNKVDDGTFGNMVALLGGQTAHELAQTCSDQPMHWIDNCTFVWQHYKAANYQTVYIEDELGTFFNYADYDFRDQPTDYYLPTLLREMISHLHLVKDNTGLLCTGPQRSFAIPLDVLRRLRPLMHDDDFFTFVLMSALTVESMNMPSLMDTELLALLETFERDGLLNKTVVLLASDQGQTWSRLRRTEQGAMEARQPLLIALYPGWMRRHYAMAVANLERNAHSLVTPFDVHATLLDLLDLHQLRAKRLEQRSLELNRAPVLPRGISLFLPVPETRSCQDAGIAAHYCTCVLRKPLLKYDRRAQRATAYIISQMNAILVGHPECHQLRHIVHEATIAVPHRAQLRPPPDTGVYIMVRLMTRPGMNVYEGTVHIYNTTLKMAGEISALRVQREFSSCISNNSIRPYCYCKDIVFPKIKTIYGG